MNQRAGNYTIDLTSDECYDIAISIEHHLDHNVKTHWVNHLHLDWKKEERKTLDRLEKLYQMAFYHHHFKFLVEKLDKFIEDARTQKEKS